METNKNKSKSSSEIVSKLVQSPIRKGYTEIMETNGFILPKCDLCSVDGNVFSIITHVEKTLRRAGLKDKAAEFMARAFQSESYDEVIQLCFSYVDC